MKRSKSVTKAGADNAHGWIESFEDFQYYLTRDLSFPVGDALPKWGGGDVVDVMVRGKHLPAFSTIEVFFTRLKGQEAKQAVKRAPGGRRVPSSHFTHISTLIVTHGSKPNHVILAERAPHGTPPKLLKEVELNNQEVSNLVARYVRVHGANYGMAVTS